jgi:hypothetical protein
VPHKLIFHKFFGLCVTCSSEKDHKSRSRSQARRLRGCSGAEAPVRKRTWVPSTHDSPGYNYDMLRGTHETAGQQQNPHSKVSCDLIHRQRHARMQSILLGHRFSSVRPSHRSMKDCADYAGLPVPAPTSG